MTGDPVDYSFDSDAELELKLKVKDRDWFYAIMYLSHRERSEHVFRRSQIMEEINLRKRPRVFCHAIGKWVSPEAAQYMAWHEENHRLARERFMGDDVPGNWCERCDVNTAVSFGELCLRCLEVTDG
jgi:hypothetical protein